MKYLLDTNICVFVIRRKSAAVLRRLQSHPPGEVGVTAITLAELRFGADKSQAPQRNHAAIDAFLLPLTVVAFDAADAAAYGKVRADLERLGTPIGSLDMLIAAQALSQGVVLVTAVSNLNRNRRVGNSRRKLRPGYGSQGRRGDGG